MRGCGDGRFCSVFQRIFGLSGVVENYDDVLAQLRAGGLLVESIEVGRLTRCKVEGSREKRGWYALHEFRLDNGKLMLVGAFGQWRGADNHVQKIELRKSDLSTEQRAAIRARIAEDRRRDEARRKRDAERAGMRARSAWGKCAATWTPAGGQPIASNDYLVRKHVRAHGVRFSSRGNLVIPAMDVHGNVHALQIIYHDPIIKKRKGRDKDYWPAGVETRGRFFLLGAPGPIILIAEGYATAATLHEATGLPVAVAFAANNLLPVAQALHEHYRTARLLLCADDDWVGKCPACQKLTPTAADACMHCGADTTKLQNAGVSHSAAAALAVSGAWVAPVFGDRGMRKLTDFNDLAAETTLATVRAQIEAKLRELGWSGPQAAAPTLPPGGPGAAESSALKPLLTVDEAVERYSLVYGGKGTFFDHQEHALVPKSDVLDLLQDHAWREWKTRPNRRVVRLSEIGFDPTESDPNIRCNLWGGWPTVPAKGTCSVLLELLEHLCSGENNARDLFAWVLRWLAYPIQHPGAKMKTALVLHGPQGVGKNLFFEAVMAIYGHYGRIVDQAAIEDKFNDWASRKLFLIGDEVVARQELFHVKNKLKGFVTGTWIRINPKNVAAHDEANHVNVVFLSNERQPLVLDRDDRRYAVIWTPEQLSRDFYNEVSAELKAGGVAALHDFLLNLDLGDFKPHTLPPMTAAKTDLIALSLDSIERFLHEWTAGETEYPVCPCLSMDLYAAYLRWCRNNGVQRPRESNQFLGHAAKQRGWSSMPRHVYETTACDGKTRARRILTPDEATLARHDSALGLDQQTAQWLTFSYLRFRDALNSDARER